MEDSDDHKAGSKWMEVGDIKKEKNEDGQQLDMNTNVIGREGWEDYKDIKRTEKMEEDVKKIKEEAMSPGSSNQESQALVKPELKLEPVATTDKKVKTCSKYNFFSYYSIFLILKLINLKFQQHLNQRSSVKHCCLRSRS
jgi:hypothetical protein